MNIESLNRQFGIEGEVQIREGEGGLVFVEVSNRFASARIAMQGAQVVSWAPKGEEAVIWLSPDSRFAAGKSIRGGTPICWPWFGPHASEADFPAHGHARTSEWELVSTETLADGRSYLVFRLLESAQSDRLWPHVTPVFCHITVGDTLEIELVTHNEEAQPVTITEAIHTYFHVGDIRQVQVHGLDATDYLDKVNDFARVTQQGAVAFSGEVDRVYVDTRASCVIEDPVLARRIVIDKRGSDSTVVWNPWQEKGKAMGDMGEDGYLRMLCVESANALDNAVMIPGGEEHRLWLSYRVER